MAKRFRIHPAIGVARVGNSPDAFFIGPEQPGVPANWVNDAFSSFRDEQGRIKRQAAQFRVFEYEEDAQGRLSSPREVTIGGLISEIEWRVHLANRKASFFTFNGPSGSSDAYVERSETAPTAIEKVGKKKTEAQKAKGEKEEPSKANFRNPNVPAADRARLLEIDPGEKVISTAKPEVVILTNPNAAIPFIPDLGDLRLDEGRLLVLGGHGNSGSTTNPSAQMNEYANNDTWFDDVADGSVKARVRLSDGSFVDADAAWVVIGPPDFAPGVGNVVSLYDTMWDLAVRDLPEGAGDQSIPRLREQREAWSQGGKTALLGYRPSFTDEIYPLIKRAIGTKWLFDPGEMDRASFHVALIDWELLGSESKEGSKDVRDYILKRMRDPKSEEVDSRLMPRGWGDDYKAEDEESSPASFLSLTQIQYALLEQWAKGEFRSDWTGEPGIPGPNAPTPEGLDRAALESSVGGPLFPGIEVSWLIRRREIFSEPFRLAIDPKPAPEADEPRRIGALPFRPGFFSQQMALPWQADFFDCQKEERESPEDNTPRWYMWWTAQRPDDTAAVGTIEQRDWARRLVPTDIDPDNFNGPTGGYQQMVEHWNDRLPFILGSGNDFKEEKLD